MITVRFWQLPFERREMEIIISDDMREFCNQSLTRRIKRSINYYAGVGSSPEEAETNSERLCSTSARCELKEEGGKIGLETVKKSINNL